MNVTMQKTDAVSARLTVNVEENDYKDTVVKKLKEIGRTHQIPGFRKGHVAIADLHRRFGADVTSDVINHDVFDGGDLALRAALQEKGTAQSVRRPAPV